MCLLPLLSPPPCCSYVQVGLFSLGIIPYINASIVLQLMSAAFPALKKMQREDGPQGRARFQYYQKLAAFVFAIAQVRGSTVVEKWSGKRLVRCWVVACMWVSAGRLARVLTVWEEVRPARTLQNSSWRMACKAAEKLVEPCCLLLGAVCAGVCCRRWVS